MLRSSSKTKMFGALVSFASLPVLCAVSASATEVTDNSKFRVNVSDALSVSVTTPDHWAEGDPSTDGQEVFLRNRIIVSASTNNPAGFSAFMTTKTANTSLVNTRKSQYTIPSLGLNEERTVAGFPRNYWGYTLSDEEQAPRSDAVYTGLVGAGTSPITIIQSEQAGTDSQDVYFGAKADMTMASGTYANTVVISVVTGVIENDPEEPGYNPSTPEDPATPTPPNQPTYDPTNDRTTYTTVTPNQDHTTTTTTEVSNGDTTDTYRDPHGVKKSTKSTTVNEGSSIATALAVAAAVAGSTGFIFFLIGKRRKDEEEEEEGTGEQQPPIQQ